MKKIILASASPRRSQILTDAGFTFDLLKPDIEERFPPDLSPEKVPAYLAQRKMQAAREMISGSNHLLITADTVVICEGKIYNKPAHTEEAMHMLGVLSDNMHEVITAVCFWDGKQEQMMEALTRVFMLPMSENEKRNYIDTAKPFDKAGGYAIQEWIGLNKIHRIEGDYYNVVGFPMSLVYPVLRAYLLEETN